MLDAFGEGPFVLVDQTDERCRLFFGAANRQVKWSARLLPVLARLGALKRVARELAADLPEPWATRMREEDGTPAAARAQLGELISSIDDLERLRDEQPVVPDVPVTVLTGTRVSPLERGRRPALFDAHRVTARSFRGADRPGELPHAGGGRNPLRSSGYCWCPYAEADRRRTHERAP